MTIGSLVNDTYGNMTRNAPVPTIGMAATILRYSDRTAGTVVALDGKGGFTVQVDRATRIDGNGMSESQDYSYTPDPAGALYVFKPVSRGHAKGKLRENGRKDGNGVILGFRRQYYDFSI